VTVIDSENTKLYPASWFAKVGGITLPRVVDAGTRSHHEYWERPLAT
jgi:hypothetical protein